MDITNTICYSHPDQFGLAGLYSPDYTGNEMAVFNSVMTGPFKDIKYYIEWGTYDKGIAVGSRFYFARLKTDKWTKTRKMMLLQ
ncbi:hypothetical protein ACFL4L_04225 [bacterium]